MEARARLVEKVEEIEQMIGVFQQEKIDLVEKYEAALRELEVARMRVEVLDKENKELQGEVARLGG